MKRRSFLGLIGVGGLAAVAPGLVHARPELELTRSSDIEPLELSADEWRERLTPAQYDVLREAGTEPPGSSPLDKQYGEGQYHCAGCDLLLFTSAMKYDSGTGWPSFFEHVEGHLLSSTDYYLIFPRTEYHCARCGGHQGHVFEDGPQPTGLRWCNNGVALKFVAA